MTDDALEECLAQTAILRSIDQGIKKITDPYRPVERGGDTWTWTKVGRSTEYQRQVTLTGAAQNIDLNIANPIQINRAEIYANDATAKSLTLDIYSGTLGSYARIINISLDTNQSIVVQMGAEYQYGVTPITIRIAVSASTAGKTLTIKIQTVEL